MKKKRMYLILVVAVLCIGGTCTLFAAARENKNEKNTLPMYYVISEELDVDRTTDKVNEILDHNVESKKN